MDSGLEEQSEGRAAGVWSRSLDVWYVMKSTDWPELDYGNRKIVNMAPGTRGLREGCELLSPMSQALEASLSVLWEMNLGAVWGREYTEVIELGRVEMKCNGGPVRCLEALSGLHTCCSRGVLENARPGFWLPGGSVQVQQV